MPPYSSLLHRKQTTDCVEKLFIDQSQLLYIYKLSIESSHCGDNTVRYQLKYRNKQQCKLTGNIQNIYNKTNPKFPATLMSNLVCKVQL